MNQHTEQNINEAIDWLQQTGGSIQDFATEQAPLYCQELIKYEILSSAVWLGIAVSFIIAAAVSLLTMRKGWATDDKGPDAHFARGVVSVVVILIASLPAADQTGKLIKACAAPRVVIVEHLRNLK